MSYSIQDFIELIAQLRHPDKGCPWDLKQNYDSMIPCLIEETYEVIEAIQKKDIANLREELGDLLLQVVFFSQLATEDNYFTFDDVVNDVAEKIIRRHPHVFANAMAENEEEALARWNSIKALEKSKKQTQSILDNVPSAFPALMRAQKLQKQCSKIGFDWTEIEPVFAKVEEELQEVRDEFNRLPQDQMKIEEEIGDLFFATVNLARHLKCSAEESLRKANNKFEQRFRKVEQKAKERNTKLEDLSLIEMDFFWNEVKEEEK
ncbi:nucleoside triphosphate pyrophosphohydrolase [Rodentibacter sp. Ppn85]|uniref:nucleoside triphosphate pyrophosphohydrolase n=1 Tax=Rodentibacter sp. Ppn85 TaxID=1908525 RepID=UPI00098668F4|nr:nucleoside triphosphate pyrophosphohydrolase [Rodentibacter sp. Ppn85]OOF65689.1 nucleoside triphosphate pyrophosphohydrolase [Rodentibacter sp. Ppn85]